MEPPTKPVEVDLVLSVDADRPDGVQPTGEEVTQPQPAAPAVSDKRAGARRSADRQVHGHARGRATEEQRSTYATKRFNQLWFASYLKCKRTGRCDEVTVSFYTFDPEVGDPVFSLGADRTMLVLADAPSFEEHAAHEFGHVLRLDHATPELCGAAEFGGEGDAPLFDPWPYTLADGRPMLSPQLGKRTTTWGMDLELLGRGQRKSPYLVRDPTQNFEIMSYCAPNWVSALTYDYAAAVWPLPNDGGPTADPGSVDPGASEDVILVSGSVSAPGDVAVRPVYRSSAPAPTTSASDGWTARTRSSGGAILDEVSFSLGTAPPSRGTVAPSGDRPFFVSLPWDSAIRDIEIVSPADVAALFEGSTSDPFVVIDYPPMGAVLDGEDVVLWSDRDGAWSPGFGTDLQLIVENVGEADVGDAITVTYDIPAGADVRYADGDGWDCNVLATEVTCTWMGPPLGAGDDLPPISLEVDVGSGEPTTSATVTTAMDGNALNDGLVRTEAVVRVASPACDLSLYVHASEGLWLAARNHLVIEVQTVGMVTPAGAHTVELPLPADVGLGYATGTGWSCAEAAGLETCTRPEAPGLARAESLPLLHLFLDIGAETPAATPLPVSRTLPIDDDASNDVRELLIDDTRPFQSDLVVIATPAAATAPTDGLEVDVRLRNAGRAPSLAGPVEVRVGGVFQRFDVWLDVVAGEAEGWTCTRAGPSALECEVDVTLDELEETAPLTVRVVPGPYTERLGFAASVQSFDT